MINIVFVVKKGVPKIFACGGLLCVVEALKTVIFSNIFTKTVKFLKKGTPKVFRLWRAIFKKVLGQSRGPKT